MADQASPTPSSSELSAAELSTISARVLGATPFPALVLERHTERIMAASTAATGLIGAGGEIVGHRLEEFTSDRPASGVDLVAGGRVNGFETFRVLRRPRGTDQKVRMWIRYFDHQPSSELVLVLFVADEPLDDSELGSDWHATPAVVGTADSNLLIERISNDAEELFQHPVASLVGASLISLVAEPDVPHCLEALSQVSSGQSGITLYLDIRNGVPGTHTRCEVLLMPLQPSPSCAFVFLPIADGADGEQASSDLSATLLRLRRGAEIAQLTKGVFRGITEKSVPGLSRVTTRELEIVSRLIDGDRVPAMASQLFLSQSTIRNHLASVFAKLGVASQQQLVDVMRKAQSSAAKR